MMGFNHTNVCTPRRGFQSPPVEAANAVEVALGCHRSTAGITDERGERFIFAR